MPLPSLETLAGALAAGRLTSRALLESCLERAADPAGEGARTFVSVDADGARAAADEADRRRAGGERGLPHAGIPISVKDLFDIQGQVTTAGSTVLADNAPAARDAAAVARLRRAGFVIVGRSNMTEFAYSGLGLNPHYGTPLNPYGRVAGDHAASRIPGGSSSGAAISVTDGMAAAGLGTDTGGSCRIPAALTGLVGFKPTASRVPRDGAFPLSPTLDSIGSLGRTVNCCAGIDAAVSGEPARPDEAAPLDALRIGVPKTLAFDGIDADVDRAFQRAVRRLAQAGATITHPAFTEFSELAGLNAKGGFSAAESYPLHRNLLERRGRDYDPRVRARIEKGAAQTSADLAALHTARKDWIRRATRYFYAIDVLALPTVPTIAPRLSELDDDEAYGRINLLMLRNPSFINFLDGCAISLPCHLPGEAPVGLMLAAPNGRDRLLLAVARSVEKLLGASQTS